MRSFSIHATQPKTGGLSASFLLAMAVTSVSGVAHAATPRLSSNTDHAIGHSSPHTTLVANLPTPDFQWKAEPYISLGAGYGEVGGKNMTGKTSTNAVGNIVLGLEFAQYKRTSFNASLGLMTGSYVSIYTQRSYADGETPQDVEIQEALNLMLSTKVNLVHNWYASAGVGAFLQRINLHPVHNSLQGSYQLGLGYQFNHKTSAELSYFGTFGRSPSIMNANLPVTSSGGARYAIGLLSLNYKL